MAHSWACPGGHTGSGPTPEPTCPVCGLRLTAPTLYPADPFAAPSQDDTCVKAAAPGATSDAGPPGGTDAVDQTMDRPSQAGASQPTAPPSWPLSGFPLSEPSQDDTLDPPSAQASVAPSDAGLGTLAYGSEHHGATLVKPSAAPTAAPHAPGPVPAAILSGYERLGVLGRGGMGVVYKARQLGLNRIVALKMILHGNHASAEDLIRFKIEAEAVAQLKHPNIVQIHDIGESDGKPYFSLEYLEGGSLQQRLKGDPLQPRAAAALLETIARAVDYAHRHGIVHRDLKPANILLAEPAPKPLEQCTPKITDFGLAKRLEADDQGQTGTEAVLGTPTYMAPEQARGSKTVGPAADLYALGAILYDLLTGRPPFKGTTILDTLQMVQKAEPVAPVALNNKVPRDLQTICLKCLEKEPGKRYASGAELADDLRRYIDGEPIKARPVGTVERTWKWAGRHPMAAALLAVCVAAPLLIAAVSTAAAVKIAGVNTDLTKAKSDLETSYGELADSEKQTRKERDEKEEQRKQARKAESEALKARAAALKAEEDAQDSFARAQQAVGKMILIAQKKLRNEAGTEKVREALLEEAVKMCQHFINKPGANPASRLRAARANRLSADLRARLGNTAGAEKEYLAALQLYDDLGKQADKSEAALYADEAVETALNYWSLLAGTQPDQAEKLLGKVLARMDRLPEGGSARTEAKHRRNRAVLLGHRAISHQNQGRFADAEADYQAALTELRQVKPSAEVPRELVSLETARLDVNRAALYLAGSPERDASQRAEDLKKAAQAGRNAVGLLKDLVEKNPEDLEAAIELGRAYTNLGQVHVVRKDLAAAAKLYDDAVTIFERLLGDFKLYVDYKHLLAAALGNQGLQFLRENLPERAREPLARGRALLEELVTGFTDVPAYRQDLARLCTSQGVQFLSMDQPEKALEPLQTAQKHLGEAVGQSPKNEALKGDLRAVEQNLIVCHHRLAHAAAKGKEWAKAEPHVKALEELGEKRLKDLARLPALPSDAPPSARLGRAAEALLARAELVGTLQARGNVAELRGDHALAARTVARLGEDLLPAHWPGWVEQAARLCRCARLAEQDSKLSAQGRARLAEGYLRQALKLLAGVADRVPDLAGELRDEAFDGLRSNPTFRDEYRRLLAKAAGSRE